MPDAGPGDALAVLDWRRRVFRLYAQVRAASDPAAAHASWVVERTALNAGHPASPRFGAVTDIAPYDATWRFTATLQPADGQRLEVPTATDGVVPFERIGRVWLVNDARDAGSLDVWALRSAAGCPTSTGSSGATRSSRLAPAESGCSPRRPCWPTAPPGR